MLSATLALGIFSPLLIARATAQDLCNANKGFVNFNSSKTVPLHALRSNGSIIEDKPDDTWYFSTRTEWANAESDAMTTMWLNTGKSNTTNMGSCSVTSWTYDLEGFTFSRDVLERSANDNGDCKTMLGEECVAGLKRQYLASAQGSAMSGECALNVTVPRECEGLLAGGKHWRGGLFGSNMGLSEPLQNKTLINEKCPSNSPKLNISMHGGSGTGSNYNYTVRFPQPYFLTFWPNRTHRSEAIGPGSDDVRAEILCLRPDDIEDGSPVPPSVKELLDAEGVKYNGNASDKSSGGDSEGSGDKGGALALKVTAPYLGAALIAVMMLV